MKYRGLCVALLAGALAAACSTTETRTVVVPQPVDDSCTYYGYQPGTEGYRVCMDRERAARARGRMAAKVVVSGAPRLAALLVGREALNFDPLSS